MRSNLNARLDRLEQRTGGTVDLAAEAERYGKLTGTDAEGRRHYERQDDGAYKFTVVSDAGAVTYELIGVRGEDLR